LALPADAAAFYAGAKYAVSAISPSKVDPWGADEYDYEIMDKVGPGAGQMLLVGAMSCHQRAF